MIRLIATLICLMLMSPVMAGAENIEDFNLINGRYHKKFTKKPFSGKIDEGRQQGLIKNGLKEGIWDEYDRQGRLEKESVYLNNIEVSYLKYSYSGFSPGHITRLVNYKNDRKSGLSQRFYKSGVLEQQGNYSNGRKVGLWVSYFENGKIKSKGEYKDSKMEGRWEFYNEDGTRRIVPEIDDRTKHVYDQGSGVYKDDKKISD